MTRIFLPVAFAVLAMTAVSAAADAPVDTVAKFYRAYLAYDSSKTSAIEKPAMDLSADFSAVVSNTAAACKKYADYPCGWGADGDEYLDAQEADPELTYENTGISLTEVSPGVVRVELNVFPSLKDAGNYNRTITYKMLVEGNRWVVDDVIYSDGKSTKQRLIEEAREAELLYLQQRPAAAE